MSLLVIKINDLHRIVYNANDNMSIANRLNLVNIGHHNILEFVKLHYQTQAYECYQNIRQNDSFLESICDQVISEIKPFYKCIIPSSSYTSRTNIGTSDLDFTILFDGSFDGADLESLGYSYKETIKYYLPEAYHLFKKIIAGIEIEIKVRNRVGSQYVVDLHHFIENDVPMSEKIIVTYVKSLLASNEGDDNLYMKYKYIAYDSALFRMGERNHMIGHIQ
jgi:hypothetical protein